MRTDLQVIEREFDKLKAFIEGRPLDERRILVDAIADYVEEVEKPSMKRYEKLKEENK